MTDLQCNEMKFIEVDIVDFKEEGNLGFSVVHRGSEE